MSTRYIVSSLILIIFLIILISTYPLLFPVMFMSSTLIVVAIAILSGIRMGLLAYFFTLITIAFLPLPDTLTTTDIVLRFVSFSITSLTLSWLAEKFKDIKKEANERYTSFIENSSEGIWRAELRRPISITLPIQKQIDQIFQEAYIAECNTAMAKMYGYKSYRELVNKPLYMLMPDSKENREYLTAFIKSGYQIDNAESQEVGRAGNLLYFSNTMKGVIENKKIKRAWGIQRDITTQKNQEKEIEKSQERYKTFIEDSEESIWMVEYVPPIDTTLPTDNQVKDMLNHGTIAEANNAMLRFYGFPTKEVAIGTKIPNLPVKVQSRAKVLHDFVENDYLINDIESHNSKEDGSIQYTTTSYRGIKIGDRLPRGWVVQRDITEKKKQEQEIENSKERYKTFIENSDEAIWRTEFPEPISIDLPIEEQIDLFFNTGYTAECNEATLDILNKGSLSDVLNKPLSLIGERTPNDDKFLKAFIDNGYSISNYNSAGKRNGKFTYTSTAMKGIVENGKWVRAWVVIRNTTKEQEHILEREQLLKESQASKEALEVASIEKDRFLANLSHELRTPLVSILGYSSLLLEGNHDKEKTTKMINVINKNAKLQVQLIEDLLDLSRIISGKIELDKDTFDLKLSIVDSIDTLTPQAQVKDIKLVTELEECTFYGDKKRFQQVMLNLLSNAIKFSDKGQVTVKSKCYNNYVEVKVEDTGIGIEEKDYHLLFHPFKQLDSSSTRNKQGLGLGLAIVKNIVDLHGGTVSVESKVGEGSVFTIKLPVIESVEHASDQSNNRIDVDFTGVSLLIVEDEKDSGEFLAELYKAKGATVDLANSAKEAREFIKNNKYSLYIFDISMPEEDGISLIKSVRNSGDMTRAVALTAFSDPAHEKLALVSGFDKFVKKPSTIESLMKIIDLLQKV